MLKEELLNCCKVLRLSRGLVDNSEEIVAESHQAYLLELLQREIAHREKSKRDRLIKNAGFYTLKSFDDYRFDEVKLPSGVTQEYLKQTQFMEEQKNLILYGNVGTGKTHLAIAMGIAACRRGLSVGFYRTANLVNQLADAKKAGKLSKLLSTIKKFDLLICDEWGYVPLDREAAQLLFQVISDSYERRNVVLTTNLEFSRWVSIFYDEQMTAAIIDRLVHHSYLLLYDGPSNRMRDSLMRQDG
ncbi:DNA replication protein DnaC [Propionispira arboris]|uniref:DNA replication protein DnaC n=4 Tax=Propionispira arboris TaxID=84035 RepID=A0A1H7D9U2_9FIRM|nr:IS21-like element helper ATPase IstB [Propionispira arboris]SEJ98104.1 DNA replication protein DnaC [Propionispira arboris]